MQGEAFDYVVIGGGSGGCTVAARLAEEGAGTVLLLEAGAPAEQHPETLSADGFKDAFANDALMLHRMTVPQEACGGRSLFAGTGTGMGGSGSVNGMVYTRGDRRDFTNWPPGWQWDDVVPAFAAVEQRLGVQPRKLSPFGESFVDASLSVGFRRKDHFDDGDLGGFMGCNDMNYAGTERRSSYAAMLRGRDLPGLTIRTGARVRELHMDQQRCAATVDYVHDGRPLQAAVRREVVLAAGALETPKILMLSGIGDGARLRALGIEVAAEAPSIGDNLQDHPNVCLFYQSRTRMDFDYPQLYGFENVRHGGDVAPDTCFVCYAAPASLKHSTLRMLPLMALPGKLHESALLRGVLRGLVRGVFALPPMQRFISTMFGIVVILGKPRARGSVRLKSRDPAAPALVDPAYYAAPEDRATMLTALKRARAIAGAPKLREAGTKPLSPGARDIPDDKLWAWAVGATMTTFHFAGTCRMGEDAASPVDSRLRLKALRNVRVADASVIPEIPVSALNAPSMMIGYRAASFMLAEQHA
jgi:choline dehydrogenase